MKIFTINSGSVSEGASVEKVSVAKKVEIDVVQVGESGRGRKRAYVPVQGRIEEDEKGRFILRGRLGETRSGKPKIISTNKDDGDDSCLVVFRTKIGYRGGNSHTGDRKEDSDELSDFPGRIIARGEIAQGAAGRMGGGEQIIAVMPKGVVFRTGYRGRLYGAPPAHYYLFDGQEITSLTWEEREISELF